MIFVYMVDMPYRVRGVTVPTDDDYTVYINSRLTREEQQKAYLHELLHIENCDFEKFDVEDIEAENERRMKHYESCDILPCVY